MICALVLAETFIDYIPVFGFAALCFALSIHKPYRSVAQSSAAFSFLGFTVGMSIGLSMTPVVHAIIPATLTFIAGISTYLFISQKYKSDENRLIVVMGIICFSFFMQLGNEVGAKKRMRVEEWSMEREFTRQLPCPTKNLTEADSTVSN